MRHVFRLGLILIPLSFLISTTAYPAEKKTPSRSPASASGQKLRLSDLSAMNRNAPIQLPAGDRLEVSREVRPVTPHLGRGVGVAGPVLRFQ